MLHAATGKAALGFLVGIVATTAFATGLETLFTRNVMQHSPRLHEEDHGIFKSLIAPAIGGVIAQAYVLSPEGGLDVILSLPDPNTYAGSINVTVDGSDATIAIAYDQLVRAALFIDGGRTALYTYYDEDDGILPESFARDAGFAMAEPIEGMIAIEFLASPYVSNLYLIDLELDSCLVPYQDGPLVSDLNAKLQAEAENPEFLFNSSDDSYIVSDLLGPFQMSVVDEAVSIESTLHRFYWSAEPGAVADVYDVDAYDPEACSEADLEVLQEVTELFQTLALLRTARVHDEEAFIAFLTSLSAEALVEANPTPWRDYTAAAVALYPDLNR